MRNIVWMLLLLVALLFAEPSGYASTTLAPDNIDGTPPPKSVHAWVRLSVLGLRNHLYRIIWISPQRFERSGFEKLITLTPHEYSGVLFLHSTYNCIDPRGRLAMPRALLVSAYSSKENVIFGCKLPDDERCSFLYRLSGIPGISANQSYRKMIDDISTDVDCVPGKLEIFHNQHR